MAFILGQILGAVSGLMFIASGVQKTHKKIMMFQIVDCIAIIISNILLGGYAAIVTCGVSLVRNILSYKNKISTKITVGLIIVTVIITFMFNDMTKFINWIPLVASVPYTFGVHLGKCKSTKGFILYNTAMWCVYNILIKSYAQIMFNVLACVVTLVSLIKDYRTNSVIEIKQ